MGYKEFSKSNNERRYIEISGIKKEGIKIVGNPRKKIKENWIIVLAILALVIGALITSFNVKVFFAAIVLLAVFVVLFIYGNSYSAVCEKEGIRIKQNFQNFLLDYKSIKNVFVARTVRASFFVNTYVLTIRCEDAYKFLREIELPLACSTYEEAEKFVNNFNLINSTNDRYVKFERRKSIRKIVEVCSTLVGIVIIIAILQSKGIIKFF